MLNPKHKEIFRLLGKRYPDPKFPMNYNTPMQLLAAVMLSAQSSDVMVNKITAELFKKYETVKDFADAEPEKFKQEIKDSGYYQAKAKNIINSAKMIDERFGGKIPKNILELTALPGVGRKTANVVLSELYNINEGFVVDLHIMRIAPRLGLTDSKAPEKIEQDLMKLVEKKDWKFASMQLKLHSQKICRPRPSCEICFLKKLCPSAFKIK